MTLEIQDNTVWIIKGRPTQHVLVLPGDVAADDGGGDEAVEDEGGGQDHGEQGEPVQQLQLTVPVRAAQLPYQILEKNNLVTQSFINLTHHQHFVYLYSKRTISLHAFVSQCDLLYSIISEVTHCKEIWIYIFPEMELRSLSPNFHIHVSVSGLYILTFGPPVFQQQNRQTDKRNI